MGKGKFKETAPNGYLLQRDICTIYGISRWSVNAIVKSGKLKPYQVGGIGRKFYKISDVENIMKSRAQ